jgi:hypothetical protein
MHSENSSQFIAGMFFAVYVAHSAAFMIGPTGRRQYATSSRSTKPSMRNPNSFGKNPSEQEKPDLAQHFHPTSRAQVLI